MSSYLAFLAVIALLLFVAPVSLYLVGYLSQRYLDKGSRRMGRVVVTNDKNAPSGPERLKA